MTFLLSILGFGKMLRDWAGIALRWALTPLWHMLAVALAAALAWGWIEHHSVAKWKRALHSTEVSYASAQAEAKAAQDKLNLAISARYSTIAKESYHEHQIALAGAHSAVSAYAATHRVPACHGGAPGGTKPAAVPDSSGLAAGTSGETGMVAVTSADLDQLAGNTVRAESCRAWGQSLIDAGLAISGD